MHLHTHEHAHTNTLAQKLHLNPHIVVRKCNPGIQEAETGRSSVQGQPGIHGKTKLPQTNKTEVRFTLLQYSFVEIGERTCIHLCSLTGEN